MTKKKYQESEKEEHKYPEFQCSQEEDPKTITRVRKIAASLESGVRGHTQHMSRDDTRRVFFFLLSTLFSIETVLLFAQCALVGVGREMGLRLDNKACSFVVLEKTFKTQKKKAHALEIAKPFTVALSTTNRSNFPLDKSKTI